MPNTVMTEADLIELLQKPGTVVMPGWQMLSARLQHSVRFPNFLQANLERDTGMRIRITQTGGSISAIISESKK